MTRRQLQTELATGSKTKAQLAREYGVTGPAITNFNNRHKAVIEKIRDNAADEFAGIAIAVKANRIALYNQLVEEATERGDDKTVARLLRQAAEELGHLPGRVTISGEIGTTSTYKIEGIDLEDLR